MLTSTVLLLAPAGYQIDRRARRYVLDDATAAGINVTASVRRSCCWHAGLAADLYRRDIDRRQASPDLACFTAGARISERQTLSALLKNHCAGAADPALDYKTLADKIAGRGRSELNTLVEEGLLLAVSPQSLLRTPLRHGRLIHRWRCSNCPAPHRHLKPHSCCAWTYFQDSDRHALR